MIQGYLLETLFIFRLPANMYLGIFVEIFLSPSPGKQNISDQRTNSLILCHMSYTVHLERGSLSINQTDHLDLPALPIRLRPLLTTSKVSSLFSSSESNNSWKRVQRQRCKESLAGYFCY